jgi:hypothetical protein
MYYWDRRPHLLLFQVFAFQFCLRSTFSLNLYYNSYCKKYGASRCSSVLFETDCSQWFLLRRSNIDVTHMAQNDCPWFIQHAALQGKSYKIKLPKLLFCFHYPHLLRCDFKMGFPKNGFHCYQPSPSTSFTFYRCNTLLVERFLPDSSSCPLRPNLTYELFT